MPVKSLGFFSGGALKMCAFSFPRSCISEGKNLEIFLYHESKKKKKAATAER